MLYLIGGSTRCGKSQLSNNIGLRHSIPVESCDTIRDNYIDQLSLSEKSSLFPLYTLENGNTERFHKYTVEENIEIENYESNNLRGVIANRVEEVISNNASVIFEGVQMTPHFVNELLFRYPYIQFRVAFLIKRNKTKILIGLKKYLKESNDCWLKNIPEAYLPYYADLISQMSSSIQIGCKEYKYPTYNTESSFKETINNLSLTL